MTSQWLTLKVSPNLQARGFVRRGKFWHLQFEDGTPFIPVGLNVCWSGNNLSAYERWFEAMRKNGANFARIWLVRWNMGLEWTPSDGNGIYLGLGKYALDNAWRIDELIRIAERNGVYLMLCLGYHGELADRQLYFGEQAWDKTHTTAKMAVLATNLLTFGLTQKRGGFTSNGFVTLLPDMPTARMFWRLSFGTNSMHLPTG